MSGTSRIAKGANTFVPTVALRVAVRHGRRPGAPLVEAAALLLDANGRARGDADLVFRGRPAHPSAAVRHMGDARDITAQWLELDLPRIEAEVERVLVVCSTGSGTVGALEEPAVEAFAPDGVPVVRYTVTDATTETAFVLGEFFRGSAAADPAEGRRLRLRVEADNRWTLTFRPLADARRLEFGHELTGRGPEVLLYTGPVADLKVRLRDEDGDGSYSSMYGYEVAGHTTIAAAAESLLVNEAGRSTKVSVPLPEGPLLLLFKDAEGPWRMKLRAV